MPIQPGKRSLKIEDDEDSEDVLHNSEPPAKKFKIPSDQYLTPPQPTVIIELAGRTYRHHATFYFNKAKLMNAAQYFNGDDPDRIAEKESGIFVLKDIFASIFGIMLTWIDTADFDVAEHIKRLSFNPHERKESIKLRWLQFISLNILAEKMEASAFQSAVMDELVVLAKLHEGEFGECIMLSAHNFNFVYERSKAGSPLRRFIVDLFMVQDLSPAMWQPGSKQDVSEAFLKDLLEAGIRVVRSSTAAAPWDKEAGDYHGYR